MQPFHGQQEPAPAAQIQGQAFASSSRQATTSQDWHWDEELIDLAIAESQRDDLLANTTNSSEFLQGCSRTATGHLELTSNNASSSLVPGTYPMSNSHTAMHEPFMGQHVSNAFMADLAVPQTAENAPGPFPCLQQGHFSDDGFGGTQ